MGGNTGRARKWVFTCQGHFLKDLVEMFLATKEEISYIKVAQEIGEGGQAHLQGYLECMNKVSLVGCKKLFKGNEELGKNFMNPHLEIAWDSQKAQDYIGNENFIHADGRTKGGQVVWIYEKGVFVPDKGEARRAGKSWNDSLLEMKALIDGGCEVIDLYEKYFVQMVYTGKAMKDYLNLVKDNQWKKIAEESFGKDISRKELLDEIQKKIDEEGTPCKN